MVAEQGLVLFAGFTGIVAWGRNGQAWDTGGIVYDDLKMIEIDGNTLIAEGSSPPGRTRTLHISLQDGSTRMLPELPGRCSNPTTA